MNPYAVSYNEAVELSESEVYKFSDECDWIESALVFANSESDAIALAELYDRNSIAPDNVFYPDCYGQIVVALVQQD